MREPVSQPAGFIFPIIAVQPVQRILPSNPMLVYPMQKVSGIGRYEEENNIFWASSSLKEIEEKRRKQK